MLAETHLCRHIVIHPVYRVASFCAVPADTHFDIAMDCVAAGMHVLVTKPIVMTLAHHRTLADAAAKAGVLVAVEVLDAWSNL